MLTRIFGILPNDRRKTLLLFFYLLFLIAGLIMGKSVRDGLFLSQSNPLNLPYLYIAIAILMGVAITIFSRFNLSLQKSVMAVQTFVALSLLFFWYLFSVHSSSIALSSLYIWVSIYGAITTSQFWLLAGQLNDARSAKRVFGFIGSGGILGGIAGGFTSRFLAQTWGTEQLLPVISVMFLVCTFLVRALPQPESGTAEASIREESMKFGNALKALKESRYLLWITVVLFTTELVSTFVDFQFKVVSSNVFPDKNQLTAFLGTFYGSLNVANFLFQAFLTTRIIGWAGVKGAILFLPLTIISGSLAIFSIPVLWAVIWLKIGDDGLRHSVHRSVLELLYLPLPAVLREKVKLFLDSFAVQAAAGFAGLLLLIYTRIFASAVTPLAVVVFAVSLIWLSFSFVTNREYINAFREGLKKRVIDPESIGLQIVDVSTLETLVQALNSTDERVVLYAIEFLQRGGKTYLVSPWLLHHPSSRVRLKVVELISQRNDRSALSLLKGVIQDEDVEVQAEALQTICLLDPESHEEMVVSLSYEKDPKLRRAAILCAALGEEEQQQRAHRWLEEMIETTGENRAVMQVEAAKALARLPASFHDLFPTLFANPDRQIVREAIRSAAVTKNRDLIPFLIEKLGDRKLKAEAREALVKFGTDIIPLLEQALTDDSVPLWARRHIPRTIGAFGSQEAADTLFRHFDHNDPFLRNKILKALNQLRALHPEFKFDRQRVEEQLMEESKEYFNKLALKHAIFSRRLDTDKNFLARSLERRLEHHEDRIFRLLALIYPDRDVFNAYTSLKSKDGVFRGAAIEYMDNSLDRSLRRIVLPMIDNVPDSEKLLTIQSVFPVRKRSADQALLEILTGNDPWLTACAVYWIYQEHRKDLYGHVAQSLHPEDPLVQETIQWVKGQASAEVSPNA